MNNRRMFSNRIANSAKFLQMPIEAQLLYFHMILRADDDGVVETYPITKLLGIGSDNFKVLLAKKFIIQLNEDQVVVIIDWLEHNKIRADRKKDSIYKDLLLKVCPDIKLIAAKNRSDVKDNSKRVKVDSPSSVHCPHKLSKVKLSKVNNTSEKTPKKKKKEKDKPLTNQIVNYFFELKGWADKEKGFYKKNKIIYSRFTKPAKELLELCDNDLLEAKDCLKKLSDWAISRDLDWSIETVFKKWYDLDKLQPKEKRAYYKGDRVFKMSGKLYVLSANGEKREFAGNENEIIYK